MALINDVLTYENGEMNEREVIIFFGTLIESGLAWQLQGSYGRQAMQFIKSGILNSDGSVNYEILNEAYPEITDQQESFDLTDFNDREEEQTRLLNGEE